MTALMCGFHQISSLSKPPPAKLHHLASTTTHGAFRRSLGAEMRELDGRWYVYFAAEHPAHGRKSYRTCILGGLPSNQDQTSGPWQFLGPIRGIPTEQWTIVGTVIDLAGGWYMVYSGWPFRNPGLSDKVQEPFIIKLTSLTEA